MLALQADYSPRLQHARRQSRKKCMKQNYSLCRSFSDGYTKRLDPLLDRQKKLSQKIACQIHLLDDTYHPKKGRSYALSRRAKARDAGRIVRAAARRFRRHGESNVAIADLMQELELTHGGFYKHFDSKQALFIETISLAFEDAAERIERVVKNARHGTELKSLIEFYLSGEHCDGPDDAAQWPHFRQKCQGNRKPFGSTSTMFCATTQSGLQSIYLDRTRVKGCAISTSSFLECAVR